MYEPLINLMGRRPALYEQSTAAFWNDPHISKGMLEAHLDPYSQGATREHAFVDRSAAWIRNILPPTEFPKLLDLGCGPGLYDQRFCASGYEVTGVDISDRSIRYASENAAKQNLRVRYRLQNYLILADCDEYDVATMIFCDYGALSEEDRRLLLKNTFRALKPGGALLLDVFTLREYRNRPETTSIQHFAGGFWSEQEHVMIYSFFRFDDIHTFCRRYIVLTDSALQCYHIWDHAFDAEELSGELTDAGFSKAEFYADVAGAPYRKNGKTLCAIARKSL